MYVVSNPVDFQSSHLAILVYAFSKALDPHHFRPTLGHSFIRLLETRGLLQVCFTQNIDGLERKAHITPARLVEAHGSFATQHCIDCREPFDEAEMKRRITEGRVTHCESCGGLVKPDIVFFGESVRRIWSSLIASAVRPVADGRLRAAAARQLP